MSEPKITMLQSDAKLTEAGWYITEGQDRSRSIIEVVDMAGTLIGCIAGTDETYLVGTHEDSDTTYIAKIELSPA